MDTGASGQPMPPPSPGSKMTPRSSGRSVRKFFGSFSGVQSSFNEFIPNEQRHMGAVMETETIINVVGTVVLIALLGLYLFVLVPLHRSEEHTSELQSLMSISYAVFCLKKKNN